VTKVGIGHTRKKERKNILQSISVFFHLSQGQIEELTSLLSEMSGTPITMEMTCKWLDLEPQMKEIPYDSLTKNLIDSPTITQRTTRTDSFPL